MTRSSEDIVDVEAMLERLDDEVVDRAEAQLVADHDGSVHIIPAAVVRGIREELQLALYQHDDAGLRTARLAVLLSCLDDAVGDQWNGRL